MKKLGSCITAAILSVLFTTAVMGYTERSEQRSSRVPTETPTVTATAEPTGTMVCINDGDVIDDGILTMGDSQTSFLIALEIYSPTFEEACAADCDGNGDVTAGDSGGITWAVFNVGSCADPLVTPTPAGTPEITPTPVPGDDILWVENYSGHTGDTVNIEIMVSNAETSIDVFTFDFQYDPGMLTFNDCTPGDLNPGWIHFLGQELIPGIVRAGAFGIGDGYIPAGSYGSLLTLSFTVTCETCEPGDTCSLTLLHFHDDISGFYRENGVFTFNGTALPTATPTPTNTPQCIHSGDVNFDGTLTAGDAQLAFNITMGTYTPSPEEACAADCNGDETVTAGDAQQIFGCAFGGSCADPLPFQ